MDQGIELVKNKNEKLTRMKIFSIYSDKQVKSKQSTTDTDISLQEIVKIEPFQLSELILEVKDGQSCEENR